MGGRWLAYAAGNGGDWLSEFFEFYLFAKKSGCAGIVGGRHPPPDQASSQARATCVVSGAGYHTDMEALRHNHRVSREEYLAGESLAGERHEYVAGQVYAMSGGTLNHQRVAGNFHFHAKSQLFGKSCFPTGSDFKLLVALGGGDEAFYYPDGMIICVPLPGNALFTDAPSVVLEVLSPHTRRIDEVQKLRDYVTIPTLQTYVLAEADEPYLTVHRRDGQVFRREIFAGADAVLHLPEVEVVIRLGELYDGVG